MYTYNGVWTSLSKTNLDLDLMVMTKKRSKSDIIKLERHGQDSR
jgi:hypothetical protein